MAEHIKKSEYNWYVVYTKARWEKKIHDILTKKGIHSWCPLKRTTRQWSDRKKIILEPVFSNYLFVHINSDQLMETLTTDGVLFFVSENKHPKVIRPCEIDTVKRFLLEDYKSLTVVPESSLQALQKVYIIKGVFLNHSGTVIQLNKRTVLVNLQSLDQGLLVEFNKDFVLPQYNSVDMETM